MPETEKTSQELFHDFLYLTAVVLVAAVALLIAAAVLSGTTFSGIPARDRVELISGQSANLLTAGLVLAAVVALFHVDPERTPLHRFVLIATLVVAGVIAILAVYTIGDVVSRHIPTGDDSSSIGVGLAQGATLKARIAGMLPALGALLIALLAMFGVNRMGQFVGVSGSHEISDDPQDLWEDE
jgi:hypothetical protein